jgi:hypothetical protein
MYFLQIIRFATLGTFQSIVDIAEQTSEHSTRADL